MADKITLTENTFDYEDVTYQAIVRPTCMGCAFEFVDPCILTENQPYCMSVLRHDGQDIVWQKVDEDSTAKLQA